METRPGRPASSQSCRPDLGWPSGPGLSGEGPPPGSAGRRPGRPSQRARPASSDLKPLLWCLPLLLDRTEEGHTKRRKLYLRPALEREAKTAAALRTRRSKRARALQGSSHSVRGGASEVGQTPEAAFLSSRSRGELLFSSRGLVLGCWVRPRKAGLWPRNCVVVCFPP